MSAAKYWVLVGLSLLIATLIVSEISCENQVASLTYTVSVDESRVAQAQRQNEVLRQLIQSMAMQSQHDSGLAGLLAKRGLHPSFSPLSDANGPAALPTHVASPPMSPSTAPIPPLR